MAVAMMELSVTLIILVGPKLSTKLFRFHGMGYLPRAIRKTLKHRARTINPSFMPVGYSMPSSRLTVPTGESLGRTCFFLTSSEELLDDHSLSCPDSLSFIINLRRW